MRSLVAKGNFNGCHKVVLQEEQEGVYLFIYEHADSKFPEQDYLEDSFQFAKEICLADYGIPLDAWK